MTTENNYYKIGEYSFAKRQGQIEVYDENGDDVHMFPDSWTNEQMLHALSFAKNEFEKGRKAGEYFKAYQIRRALGIKEQS